MEIKVDQAEQISIADVNAEFEKIWADCLKEIYHEDRLIHHVEIDGQIFYSDYENIIKNNLDVIKEIHIITLSRQESITDTENTLSEYLLKYIPGMEKINNKLYGDVSPEAWGEFATGLEGLQWIVSSLEFLQHLYESDSKELALTQSYYSQLTQTIRVLDEEMQNNNLVAVADTIQYELLPCLSDFLSNKK